MLSLAFFCISAILGGTFLWQLLALITGPQLACDEPSKDLGSVVKGATVPVSFEIRNVGNAALHIDRIKPSCGGCLTVSPPTEISIKPGCVYVLHVTLHTNGIEGAIKKHIVLFSNDGRKPHFALGISATIEDKVGESAAESQPELVVLP